MSQFTINNDPTFPPPMRIGGFFSPDELWEDVPEDYLLPVVNSPRVGVCSYTGEEDIETDGELW